MKTIGHPFSLLEVPQEAVAIHWFGQSSFAMKDRAGTIVQIDPYFPRQRPPEKYLHPEPPLDEATLRTDFVLLTHDHSDHTCIESLLRISESFPQARFVGPAQSIQHAANAGLPRERMIEVTAGGKVSLGSMTAHAVWAKPPEGDPAHDIAPPDVDHLGYVVEAGERRIYFSGDPILTFAGIKELVEPVRSLRPDHGFLTTHPTEGEFPLFDGSAAMARGIGLKTASPSHYQCFVKRTFDPADWAAAFGAGGPQPLVIPYNTAMLY